MAETAPRYAPEDPTLPKPWKGLVDGSTGFLYFWNPETNVTTYDRPDRPKTGTNPSPAPAKSVAAPISSSVHVHHSTTTHRSSGRGEEDGSRYNGDVSNNRPKIAAIPSGRSYQVGQVLSVGTVGTDSAAVCIYGGILRPPSFILEGVQM